MWNLDRFVLVQQRNYEDARREMQNGKRSRIGSGMYYPRSRGWEAALCPRNIP